MKNDPINTIPPQAPELEQAVIGASLIEAGTFEEVYSILDAPEYFYKDEHRKIFESMLNLFKSGKKIDGYTVNSRYGRFLSALVDIYTSLCLF